MTNLADLLPAGGGQNNTDFVADGTISSGAPVLLTAAGKATPIVSTAAVTGDLGQFEAATTNETATVYDSNANKIVVMYRDDGNSYYLTSIVGTITGGGTNTVSWGTPQVFHSYGINAIAPVFQSSDNQIVVSFQAWGTYGSRIKVIPGQVNGTSMDWSSAGPQDPDGTHATDYISSAFDANAGKTVTAWKKNDNSTGAYSVESIVITVSGTGTGSTVSFGSISQVDNGGDIIDTSCVYDSNVNKILVTFGKSYDSYKGFGRVGTVSGTSISYGTEAQFMTGKQPLQVGTAFDTSANKIVITGADNANNSQGDCCLGTISGTDITYSTPVVFSTGNGSGVGNYSKSPIATVYNPDVNKTFVAFFNIGDNYSGQYVEGTVSGSTISFSAATTFQAGVSGQVGANYISAAYDTNVDRFLIAFVPYAVGPYYGQGRVIQVGSTNLTSTNLLGIASGAISDTATGTINTWGSRNEVQTGLTIGSDYYVQNDGRIEAGVTNIAYDISSATYTQNFSVSSQSTDPVGLLFSPDGTSMYVVSGVYPPGAKNIFQYALTTAFDISTASLSKDFDASGEDSQARGIQFNLDGTKMFINGVTGDAYFQYSLSSAYDISTGSYDSVSFSLSSQDGNMEDVVFNADGTKFYGVGLNTYAIYQYSCSSAFDLSTASYDSVSFSISSQDNSPRDLFFKPDGSKMWLLGRQNNSIYQYSLSSAFDLSTASYDSISFSVNSEETSPGGLAFSANGEKFYVCGGTGDDVNQYATTANSFSTTYLIGKAITATQINIKDYTG